MSLLLLVLLMFALKETYISLTHVCLLLASWCWQLQLSYLTFSWRGSSLHFPTIWVNTNSSQSVAFVRFGYFILKVSQGTSQLFQICSPSNIHICAYVPSYYVHMCLCAYVPSYFYLIFMCCFHKGILLLYCCACVCVLAQSCLTLCNPMDYRPPDSSVHVISQARILACPSSDTFLTQRSSPCLLHVLLWQVDYTASNIS